MRRIKLAVQWFLWIAGAIYILQGCINYIDKPNAKNGHIEPAVFTG